MASRDLDSGDRTPAGRDGVRHARGARGRYWLRTHDRSLGTGPRVLALRGGGRQHAVDARARAVLRRWPTKRDLLDRRAATDAAQSCRGARTDGWAPTPGALG